MTQTDTALWGLPDPDTQSEFYADVPVKRLIAWVVDALLIFLTAFLIAILTVGLGFFFFGFLILVVAFVYRTVSLANRSATLGMRLVAIEMRTHNGQRFDLATAALHTIAYQVSVSMVVPQIISIVLMLTSARAQGLTDHALGTAALNMTARA
ncbi:RDD family protein [Maritimibacter sp. HL-12]|uniref:RDD family protein n=1 Tax=Maritimibacter sp. HL-12 TaxID=1162418 RepID=UPI000A0F0B20|nr:RDD family protein [Maritimibacter sp. HL-12]SMH55769.1 RDD family protein [Maritimibacter sp. HL-12]